MGNCLARTGDGVGQSECRHERLNEHSDKYFEHVEARNSVDPKKRWWRFLLNRAENKEEDDPETCASPTSTMPGSEEEVAKSKMPDESNDGVIMSPSSKKRQSRKRIKEDAQVDGWQVKRKGNALQLRLAKNRFIQLAASSDVMSPISLDSFGEAGKNPAAARSSFNPLESSMTREELNYDFDNSMGSGAIWVEVSRNNKVSAVAMSRLAATASDDTKYPLFLAIGGEDGVLTVTEILDEYNGKLGQEGTLSVGSSYRKFGETLEYKVRTITGWE